MDSYSFGRLQASFAIMRDQLSILGYLIDKIVKGDAIIDEEHKLISKIITKDE